MCGIIGYIGQKSFFEIAHQGLSNLEYRGYDSAGVAYFLNSKIKVYKQKGNVEHLFKKLPLEDISHCGIGHTRWATHGKPSNVNAHPHTSAKGYFSLVHNGIIENYAELKEKYLNGVVLKSGTDTEIISNLIEIFYLKKMSVLEAIKKTLNLLKGSYALAILFKKEPTKIYFARNKSPLVIGQGNAETFISSDLIGIRDFASTYCLVDNLSYGFITNNSINLFNFNGDRLNEQINPIIKSVYKSGKDGYSHYMKKEIYEIPLAIEQTASLYQQKDNVLNLIPKDYFANINRIRIIACGTSYHSGLIGEKYLKELANIDCECKVASEFLYCKEILDKQTLCLFISQSGETADTLSAIQKAKELGAKTIGITNVPTSSITTVCDYILPLNAGPEIAVASTKAYNCQLTVLLIFALYLKNGYKCAKREIDSIIKFAKGLDIDECAEQIKFLSSKLKKSANIYMLGRNFDYVTSMEACLKLKEISYIPCEAYPAGELKHGTLALIHQGVPVIAILTEQSLIEKTLMIASQVCARGGDVFIVTNTDVSNYDTRNMSVIKLKKYSTYLQPIYNIIAFQLLAYEVSTSLGYDPDRPRNLAKSVTVE